MFFKQHPDQAESVKLGLIQLLGKENETFMARVSLRELTARRIWSIMHK